MRTRRIARVVAAEAAYRAKRRNVRVGMVQAGEVSALRANLLQGVFFTMFSFIAIVTACYAKSLEAVVFVLLSTVALTAFFNLMFMVSFTAIFFSEELFKPLQILPIPPDSLRRILVTAYLLYWGGLSVLALSLPAALIIPVAASRYAPYALLTAAASITVYLASIEAGLILGSYSRLAKSNLAVSIASAAGWVLLMMLFAFMPQIPIYLEQLGIGLSPLYALIPFAGFILAPLYPLPSTASLAATLAVLYLLERKASRLLIGEPKTPLPTAKAAGFRTLRPLGRTLGIVRKDYLLISREPRRLAGILYLYVFPLIFLLGGMLTDTWSILAGVAAGASASMWLYIEGEAARHLYEMPLTYLDVFKAKLLDSLIPLALIAVLLPLMNAQPLTSLLLLAGYVAEASAMLALTIHTIPREPSAWSEAATTRTAYMLLMMGSMAVFAMVPIAACLVDRIYGLAATLGLAAASLSVGTYYAWRRGPL